MSASTLRIARDLTSCQALALELVRSFHGLALELPDDPALAEGLVRASVLLVYYVARAGSSLDESEVSHALSHGRRALQKCVRRLELVSARGAPRAAIGAARQLLRRLAHGLGELAKDESASPCPLASGA